MSIERRRVSEILEKASEEFLVEGRVPPPHEVQVKLNEWLQANTPGSPRMQLRMQPFRSKFDRASFNKSVTEALEDLDLLFAENLDIATRVTKGLNGDDVRYKAFRYQLGIIDDALENLLLVEPAATSYFASVFDTFNDMGNVNQDDTTAEVDLETGSVRLPVVGGVGRVNLGFMRNRARANLRFVPETAVQSSDLLAGTRFGNLFDDLIGNVWAAQVTTNEDVELGAEFTIPVAVVLDRGSTPIPRTLATMETMAKRISRIDLEPHTPTPMGMYVEYSVDGRNYTRIPGFPDPILLEDKRVQLNFISTLVRYLRFRMFKTPDETLQIGAGDSVYRYTFGLKMLAVYQAGYSRFAELVTTADTPEGLEDSFVSKVALDVDERVPQGTDIRYFVALDGSSEWRPISTASREQDAPRIVEFGSSIMAARSDNRVRIQTTPSVNSTRNGITFYDIMTTDPNVIPLSTRLFRGGNAWRRKVNLQEIQHSVRNNYVVFTLSDNRQKLYIEVEDERVTSPGGVWPTNPTRVPLQHAILADESLPVVPVGSSRENPNYSVRRVLHVLNTAIGDSLAAVVASPSTDRATVSLTLSVATGKIVAGQQLYLSKATAFSGHWEVISVTEGSTVDVVVSDPRHNLVDATNVTWQLGYRDVTTQVDDIDANHLILSSNLAVNNADEFSVSYRRPLGLEHELVTTSVVVKGLTEGSTVYQAGRDYVVDPETKSIARLSEGQIQGTGDQVVVRVDFNYRVFESDLDTYSTFLLVDSDEPKVIELTSAIGVDDEAGEGVYIDNGQAMLNVSDRTTFPPLPRGWRQIVVRSKPLVGTGGSVDTASALYKVLVLTDANGNFIFRADGRYFVKATAHPEAMKETNLFKLQTGVRVEDRSFYALDGNKIVVNWDPTTLPDTIYPIVGVGPTLSLLSYEEFELEYRIKRSDITPGTALKLKAEFSRGPKQPTGLTPELRAYNLKFSY